MRLAATTRAVGLTLARDLHTKPGSVPLLRAGATISDAFARTLVARHGVSIPARASAKAKTFVQSFAVGFALAPPTSSDARWVANSLLWVSVVLAMVSFAQYVVDGRRARAR